ncbi:MAG: hypothetical protein WD757_07370 [Actinomycetota bacterium]
MKRILISALVLVVASFAGPATDALANPEGMPDAFIKRLGGGDHYHGFDKINVTGRNQRARDRISEGGAASFKIKLRNLGKSIDDISVNGCDGTHKFGVRYSEPSGNAVTAAVKNGNYTIQDVPEDMNIDALFVGIVAKSAAGPGDKINCKIRFISDNQPGVSDVVRAFVKVV